MKIPGKKNNRSLIREQYRIPKKEDITHPNGINKKGNTF